MSAEAAKVIMQANARTGQANLVFITVSPCDEDEDIVPFL
jgi:hypothetical protein